MLLTPKKAATVPKLVISLGRRYVPYINRQYRRTGPLWDSRYKCSLIQVETYLLTGMRYIEMNPIRAALVDDPAHYPLDPLSEPTPSGSSHRCSALTRST